MYVNFAIDIFLKNLDIRFYLDENFFDLPPHSAFRILISSEILIFFLLEDFHFSRRIIL